MRAVSILVGAVALVAALGADLWAAPEDVTVGATRAVLSRAGTRLRDQPTMTARTVTTLEYATTVTVVEVRQPWIRVNAANGQSGWLRAAETASPQALSGPPATGAVATRRGAMVGRAEVSAAGRQLTDTAEQKFKEQRTDLGSAYALLDQLEAARVPDAEVADFVARGRLGRPQGNAR